MSAFDKVIGYKAIKNELLQICDMIRNKEIYEKLGAKLPSGVMLHGDPGLGKTLMAKSFIEESGLKAYSVRRNKSGDGFVDDITEAFRQAKENAPCVVFLDDLDKFANEDMHHRDADEYVAVQAGIDEVKDCEVFVLATVNEMGKLPDSLIRTGRFDRKIEVACPSDRDSEEIIAHYLSDKKLSPDVDMEDLSKMIRYSSCAELEAILNEAAISAAYGRKPAIDMQDLVQAVLRQQYYTSDDFTEVSAEDRRRTALHEAGHLVVAEVLCPGSVGLASLRLSGGDSLGGFVHRCKEISHRAHHVIIALAGKAAVELYYSDTCASGCQSDIERALKLIRDGISENATLGFGMIDAAVRRYDKTSESLSSRTEAVTQAEMERHIRKAGDILLKNRDFLEKTADALFEKGTLLYSDIRAIKAGTTVTEVAV